jgi:hypothetical protein
MNNLIILQENTTGHNIIEIADAIAASGSFKDIIVVLNDDFENTEEFYYDMIDQKHYDPNLIIMRDYFYKEFGFYSSIYTGLENIENEGVVIFYPSTCVLSDGTIDLLGGKLIHGDEISEYESYIAEKLKK